MQRGGNAAAKAFFQSHGMRLEKGNSELKYQSRAAKLYMAHLKKLIAGGCGHYGCVVVACCTLYYM